MAKCFFSFEVGYIGSWLAVVCVVLSITMIMGITVYCGVVVCASRSSIVITG
jgi:hypothetical protein